jgi:5-methylcytosine-specific restriction enzyme subunit McrC
VTVVDSVGIVAISGLQLVVSPKIPQLHLLYLAGKSGALPAFASRPTQVDDDENLAVLVARWFVAALERLLEEGLARGYRDNQGELTSVRGRVDQVATARLVYRGRLAVHSEYEEFGFDTPLNRVLRAAARFVAAAIPFPSDLRRRAIRAAKRMDEVGELRGGDLAVRPERATAHYGDAATLAREVLRSSGRNLETGQGRSWGFLLRTPSPVEVGIRTVLKEGLAGELAVGKGSFQLHGARIRANPDLVFGDVLAVGDVKYKRGQDSWNRPDLYEVVAFAAAAERDHAVLANFRPTLSPGLPAVQVGAIKVTEVSWPADAELEPAAAADIFVERIRSWIASRGSGMGTAGFEPATSRV